MPERRHQTARAEPASAPGGSADTPSRTAPGPPGDPVLGHLRAFRHDVLGLLLAGARDHGDVVRFRVGPVVAHLVNHPDAIAHVLQTAHRQFDKQTRSTAAIKAICDESLLTASGAAWETRRRLVQPALHRTQIAALATAMTGSIASHLARWQPGVPIDMASEMMRLTFVLVGRTVLGTAVDDDAGRIEGGIGVLLAQVFARWGRLVPWPAWLPTPAHRRFDRALADVDAVVARIIAEHRADPGRPSLLALLMAARDGDAAVFGDAELRNETITLLLAGHETTASALAWTFALLAQHPGIAAGVHAEVDTVLAGRVPTLDDLPRLTATRAVIQEAMRLHPPIWAIERRAIDDTRLGGYLIPKGSSVIISPYVLHRHSAFWREPDRVDPARFEGGATPPAYMPFGAGPRHCVGRDFAMLEARLIVAMVCQAFRLELAAGQVVAPEPGLTLRLRHGLRLIPAARTS